MGVRGRGPLPAPAPGGHAPGRRQLTPRRSRFLFVTWNGGGNVPPTLAIARALVGRGHSVRVLAPLSLRADVEAATCDFVPYARAPVHRERRASAVLGRTRAALVPPELIRAAPATLFAEDLLDEIEREPADVLIVDFMLAGSVAAAERAALPTAVLMHTVYCLPAPERPTFGPGLVPASGPGGRVRDRALTLITRRAQGSRVRDLNAARRRLGLAPVASAANQLERVDRLLVMTSKAFDPPVSSLPGNVRYVGAQFDDHVVAADADFAAFRAEAAPLIVMTLSMRFALPKVAQRTLDALGALSVYGLITLGFSPSADGLRLPPNVSATQFVPHRAVLPRASLVITHGGLGTVMAAIAHGVPLLCIPLKNDQFENAARVEAVGAGLRMSKHAGARALARTIKEVLSEPCFRTGAQRLAAELAGEQRGLAIEELEALIARSSSRVGSPSGAVLTTSRARPS
ncbi:MAG: glycosyltransferase [Actinobacteria bacterium]|nr:glycosyltransferase [Actinomycetota bacterium]